MKKVSKTTTLERLKNELKERKKGSFRRVVALLSKGNVNLQRGHFATEEEIEELRTKVISYDFTAL